MATGNEDRLRKIVEANCKGMAYPKLAVGRAIGYCSAIYGIATHGEVFDPEKIEAHFRNKYRNNFPGVNFDLINDGIEGRGLRLRGLNDPRPGYMITVASGIAGEAFSQIYIVFRGSRSDTGDDDNPEMAGFDKDSHGNVDYAANLTGRQDPPWWNPEIKIRRGFLELYKSMSIEITQELDRLLAKYPRARVIVTGHSLGAALAVVCAHHLQYHRGNKIYGGGPFCFPFCTPRVGNFQFAMDFKVQLGTARLSMPGEINNNQFSRCMNFCMKNDPVSTHGSYGYKNDRSDNLRGRGTPAANRSFVRKAIYGLTKSTNKKIIFYQTPNLYELPRYAPWNIHQYTKMQQYFLGKAIYLT